MCMNICVYISFFCVVLIFGSGLARGSLWCCPAGRFERMRGTRWRGQEPTERVTCCPCIRDSIQTPLSGFVPTAPPGLRWQNRLSLFVWAQQIPSGKTWNPNCIFVFLFTYKKIKNKSSVSNTMRWSVMVDTWQASSLLETLLKGSKWCPDTLDVPSARYVRCPKGASFSSSGAYEYISRKFLLRWLWCKSCPPWTRGSVSTGLLRSVCDVLPYMSSSWIPIYCVLVWLKGVTLGYGTSQCVLHFGAVLWLCLETHLHITSYSGNLVWICK